MKKLFKLGFLTLSAMLILFSCQSNRNEKHGGMPPGEKSIDMAFMPVHDENAEILMKINFLLYTDDTDLSLSSNQAESVKSILLAWKEALTTNQAVKGEVYAERIKDELTVEQSAYMPSPSGPEGFGKPPRDNQAGPGQPPQKPENDYLEMINQLLDRL